MLRFIITLALAVLIASPVNAENICSLQGVRNFVAQEINWKMIGEPLTDNWRTQGLDVDHQIKNSNDVVNHLNSELKSGALNQSTHEQLVKAVTTFANIGVIAKQQDINDDAVACQIKFIPDDKFAYILVELGGNGTSQQTEAMENFMKGSDYDAVYNVHFNRQTKQLTVDLKTILINGQDMLKPTN